MWGIWLLWHLPSRVDGLGRSNGDVVGPSNSKSGGSHARPDHRHLTLLTPICSMPFSRPTRKPRIFQSTQCQCTLQSLQGCSLPLFSAPPLRARSKRTISESKSFSSRISAHHKDERGEDENGKEQEFCRTRLIR